MHQPRKSKRIDAASNQDKRPTWHSNRAALCSRPYQETNCIELWMSWMLPCLPSSSSSASDSSLDFSWNSFWFCVNLAVIWGFPSVLFCNSFSFNLAPFVFGPFHMESTNWTSYFFLGLPYHIHIYSSQYHFFFFFYILYFNLET